MTDGIAQQRAFAKKQIDSDQSGCDSQQRCATQYHARVVVAERQRSPEPIDGWSFVSFGFHHRYDD